MNIHAIKDELCDAVVVSSLLHTLLPPWDAEAIAAVPGFQRWYRILIYVLGYIGLNGRSTVYRSISKGESAK